MNVVTAPAALMTVGVAVVATTVWLGRRRSQVSQLLSVLVGCVTGLFCGFAALALIATT
jgi:hypothetical protein